LPGLELFPTYRIVNKRYGCRKKCSYTEAGIFHHQCGKNTTRGCGEKDFFTVWLPQYKYKTFTLLSIDCLLSGLQFFDKPQHLHQTNIHEVLTKLNLYHTLHSNSYRKVRPRIRTSLKYICVFSDIGYIHSYFVDFEYVCVIERTLKDFWSCSF